MRCSAAGKDSGWGIQSRRLGTRPAQQTRPIPSALAHVSPTGRVRGPLLRNIRNPCSDTAKVMRKADVEAGILPGATSPTVEDMGRNSLYRAVQRAQCMPYSWPGEPTADYVRRYGRGTCAGKHAFLLEDLSILGFKANRLMVVGPLVPSIWPDLQADSGGLMEVHECLTVETAWAGPLLVDVTWPPAAIRAGLRGTLHWAADTDMTCAVEQLACYAVHDDEFREQKEHLRSRLYTAEDREVRDRVLSEMSARVNELP